MKELFDKADELFEKNDIDGVERLYKDALADAERTGDNVCRLNVLNELIGLYRQLSRREELLEVIKAAIATADEMELAGTIAYATTLLNAATGYRSVGQLEDAKELYDKAGCIYLDKLPQGDMLWANYYNNMSLYYQEAADYESALEYLLLALDISEANNAGFEVAVTYANLANTAILGDDYDRAKEYAIKSIACFEERGTIDPHYCAALSALGMYYYNKGQFADARDIFERAMAITVKCVGENAQYYRLKESRDICVKQIHQIRD